MCTNIDQILIADQRSFRAKYLRNSEENWIKKYFLSHFSAFNIMSYFILDLISSLLDPRLVDPGLLWSTSVHSTHIQ